MLDGLNRKIDDAQRRKDHETAQELMSELFFERDLIDAQIFALQTRRLRTLADKYLIPVPEFDADSGAWVESRVTGRWHLSPETAMKLRKEIDEEQRRIRDRWIAWFTAATGVLGAATGLASVLMMD